MIEIFGVDVLAVLAAAVVSMVVGSLWYSPFLFGKQWLAAVGKRQEDLGDPKLGYAVATVAAFVTALAVGYLLVLLDIAGAATTAEKFALGVTVGLLAWIFVSSVMAMNTVFEGRPWILFAINASNQFVTLLAAGLVMATWPF